VILITKTEYYNISIISEGIAMDKSSRDTLYIVSSTLWVLEEPCRIFYVYTAKVENLNGRSTNVRVLDVTEILNVILYIHTHLDIGAAAILHIVIHTYIYIYIYSIIPCSVGMATRRCGGGCRGSMNWWRLDRRRARLWIRRVYIIMYAPSNWNIIYIS